MERISIIMQLMISSILCGKESIVQTNNPKLKKILTYSSPDKNTIHGMTTFEYDNSGLLIKETYYYKNMLSPLIYSMYEYQNGRKAHEYKYHAIGDGYCLSQKLSFLYHGNLLIKEELRYSPNEEVSSQINYKYDKNANLILESGFQTNPLIRWETAYLYDSNNLKTKTIQYDEKCDILKYTEHAYIGKSLSYEKIFNSQNECSAEYNYRYNSDNNLLEKTKTIQDETKIIESIRYSNDQIVEKTFYDWTSDRVSSYKFKCIQVFVYE
jgi:hypothetical protein